MPKATMDKYTSAAGRKDKIGTTWEPAHVKAISQSRRVNSVSDQQFWSGIFAANAPHVLAARIGE